MKTLLLNPPGNSPPDCPWMGIPALVAHLKESGYHRTIQRDLDLELYESIRHGRASAQAARLLAQLKTRPASGIRVHKRLVARFGGPVLLRLLARICLRGRREFEDFRSATPLPQQFPENGLIRYRRAVTSHLILGSVLYYPFLSYPRFFSRLQERLFRRLWLRLGHVLAECYDLGRHALAAFFQEQIAGDPEVLDCDVIGISVPVRNQLEPALLLAETLRSSGVTAPIVLGGSYISTVYDSGWFDDSLFDHADFVILHEGEAALVALLRSLERGSPLEEVPNLMYLRDGARVENRREFIRDLDQLATPDYGGLPLELYVDRPLRLPLMGCRGCYWGRCTFCAHHRTLGTFRPRFRRADRILADIKELQHRYGVSCVFFADEAMYPPTMEELSHLILEESIDVSWSAMARFDERLDRRQLEILRSAGCYALMLGLESISKNVLEIVGKGIEPGRVMEVLKDCRDLGIKVHLFIMIGVPGEEERDLRENIEFLLRHTDLYATVQLAPFELMVGSPMWRRPHRFGIENVEVRSPRDRRSVYRSTTFESARGLSRAEVRRWVRRIEKNDVLFKRDLWRGYGFRIYQPDVNTSGRVCERRSSTSP